MFAISFDFRKLSFWEEKTLIKIRIDFTYIQPPKKKSSYDYKINLENININIYTFKINNGFYKLRDNIQNT